MNGARHDEPRSRLLQRAVSALKLSLIITIYFSLCVLILLAILGT